MPDQYILSVRWGTSRGRDTYGYTTCSIRDTWTGKRVGYCSGGGYDMRGTAFSQWLASAFPERLRALKPADAVPYGTPGTGYTHAPGDSGLYGIVWRPDGSASLNGACGFRSMERVAERIGLTVRLVNTGRKSDTIIVTDTRSVQS